MPAAKKKPEQEKKSPSIVEQLKCQQAINENIRNPKPKEDKKDGE